MSKLVKQTEDVLHTLVVEALGKAIAAGELPAAAMPSFIVEIPQDRANGDYSTNAAFVGAKVFRMAPVKIAQAIAKYIDLSDSYFSECTVAGAGFIRAAGPHRADAEVLPPDPPGAAAPGGQKGGVGCLPPGSGGRPLRRGQRPLLFLKDCPHVQGRRAPPKGERSKRMFRETAFCLAERRRWRRPWRTKD